MESRDAIKDTLAGFSAELLAVDVTDKDALSDVHSSIETVERVVGEIDEAEEYDKVRRSLELAIESLDAVVNDRLEDAGAVVDALSNVMAATAEAMESEESEEAQTEWLQNAVDELQNLLSGKGKSELLAVPSQQTTDSETVSVGETAPPPAVESEDESFREKGGPDVPTAPEAAAPSEPEEAQGAEQGLAWMLPEDTDLDILSEFTTESFDRIAQIEASLLELENNPDDRRTSRRDLPRVPHHQGNVGFPGTRRNPEAVAFGGESPRSGPRR